MMYNPGNTSGSASTAPEALSVDGRQPVWMILNEARERAFTGEVVFELDPEVFAYFDDGVVYYAERAGDSPLGQRLVAAGVLDEGQLSRGTVRVGDVEHLGRLFDREATVDRDAVIVVAESMTEGLVAELANREIASARVTAYRHHPSGIHRWFVAPRGPVSVPQPMSEVTPIGASTVDDLPGLTILDEDLLIEWDEPFDDVVTECPFAVDEFELDVDAVFAADLTMLDERALDDAADDVIEADDVVEAEMYADLVEAVELDAIAMYDDEVETSADGPEMTVIEADPDAESVGVTADAATDFAVVWPDGTEQAVDTATDTAIDAAIDTTIDTTVDTATEVADDHVAAEFVAVASDPVQEAEAPAMTDEVPDAPVPAPEPSPFALAPNGALRFEMPALELREEPDVEDAEVPDEVAEAVRRAIAAIESATSEVPVITPATQPDGTSIAPPPAPAFTGFAPPTPDMRAEVIYAQLEAELAAEEAAAAAVAAAEMAVEQVAPEFVAAPVEHVHEPALQSMHGGAIAGEPAAGVASVVFVDEVEQPAGGDDQRTSALRRLIGSLRRKDR